MAFGYQKDCCQCQSQWNEPIIKQVMSDKSKGTKEKSLKIQINIPPQIRHNNQSQSLKAMQVNSVVKNLIGLANSKAQSQTSKLTLQDKNLSVGELAQMLDVLANEYRISLPALLRKLDRLSGDLKALDYSFTNNDDRAEWTQEEDKLLKDAQQKLLIRWKGQDAVDLRKRYLAAKKH